MANVTTQLTYPVAEIPVQVGDAVNEGDIICVLDTSDLEDELAKQQESLSDTVSTAQKNYDTALENYSSATEKLNTATAEYQTTGQALESARTAFQNVDSSVSAYQTAYENALAAQQEAGAALNSDSGVVSAQAQVDSAKAALSAAQDEASKAQAQANLDAANAALSAAQANAQSLSDAYNTATSNLQAAEAQLNTAKANCGWEALQQAYSEADQAWLSAKSSYESAVENQKNAQTNLENAQDQLDSAQDSDEITELKEKIEDCTIKATQDGTVTELNVTVGAAANTGTIAVLRDTEHLKVSVIIDEDDIKQVAVGQSAIIQSDATGETEIEGTLTQLSQTATSSQDGSTGFGAEITVDSENSGLLIGLSAKAEILLSEKENVYTVPYDAVTTDEDGNSIIYARTEEGGEFEKVPVTLGMETDYYVEISGEALYDGMEVQISTSDTADGESSPTEEMPTEMQGGTMVVPGEMNGTMTGRPSGGRQGMGG